MNGEGVYLFDITFRDFCWDSVLTPAVFSSAVYSVDLNLAFDFPFTAMEDTTEGLACGGYTYELEDGRKVTISFEEAEGSVIVREDFDAESENTDERQKYGWQCILDNFKKYSESGV